MNQLQVAFLRANLLVDRLRADGEPEASVFDEARFALTWHYQWVLLHDFLPSLIGAELGARLLDRGGERYRVDGEPFIPFEFADAAYRYGHWQIRHRYRINDRQPRLAAVPGPDRIRPGRLGDDGGLVAALRRPRAPGGAAGEADRRTSGASLINLPQVITGEVDDDAYQSLAARDLQRGQATGLPSGEAVAASSASSRCRPPSAGSASMAGTARRRSGSTS